MYFKIAVFLVLIVAVSSTSFAENLDQNAINIHSNFQKDTEECNVYDEAAYCQIIAYDERGTLVANSIKCKCPTGYRCPKDVEDSQLVSSCTFDISRHWFKCNMKCIPEDV